MKNHTKVYLEETMMDPHEILCEVCRQKAVDIHHIKARGMGGSKNKDVIANLMALCRRCHNNYGDKKQYMNFLIKIHFKFLEANNIRYES